MKDLTSKYGSSKRKYVAYDDVYVDVFLSLDKSYSILVRKDKDIADHDDIRNMQLIFN